MENGLLVIAITGVSSVENLTAHRAPLTPTCFLLGI